MGWKGHLGTCGQRQLNVQTEVQGDSWATSNLAVFGEKPSYLLTGHVPKSIMIIMPWELRLRNDSN